VVVLALLLVVMVVIVIALLVLVVLMVIVISLLRVLLVVLVVLMPLVTLIVLVLVLSVLALLVLLVVVLRWLEAVVSMLMAVLLVVSDAAIAGTSNIGTSAAKTAADRLTPYRIVLGCFFSLTIATVFATMALRTNGRGGTGSSGIHSCNDGVTGQRQRSIHWRTGSGKRATGCSSGSLVSASS
jgi:hypothetical protein